MSIDHAIETARKIIDSGEVLSVSNAEIRDMAEALLAIEAAFHMPTGRAIDTCRKIVAAAKKDRKRAAAAAWAHGDVPSLREAGKAFGISKDTVRREVAQILRSEPVETE